MTTVDKTTMADAGSRTLRAGALSVELTAAGDVRAIRVDDLLVNQFLPGPHDAMPAGVYLRRHIEGDIEVLPIVGSTPAIASLSVGPDRVSWAGRSFGVDHVVDLALDDDLWVWRVTLAGTDSTRDGEYDVVVAQDMALSPPGTALSSEPYVCQYLVHRVLDHPTGPAIASRQAMTAAPRLPLVVSAIVEGATAYATDAMQTHTPLARVDGAPYGLAEEISSEDYQYEMSTPTLASHRFAIGADPRVVHAYAVYRSDFRGDLAEQAQHLDEWGPRAVEVAARAAATTPVTPTRSDLRSAPLLIGHDLADDDGLLAAAGVGPDDVLLPEIGASTHLLSFFTPDDAHVVRGTKDLVVERSHGHVLKAGDDVAPNDDILSATAYAPGVFASHVVLGNTSNNRLVTVQRHHLNLLRTSGIRVYVALPEETAGNARSAGTGPDDAVADGAIAPHPAFQLWPQEHEAATTPTGTYGTDCGCDLLQLGKPSVVTFHLGGVHWVYFTDLGRIDVRTVAAAHENRIDVLVESERDLRILATIDIESGDDGTGFGEHEDAEHRATDRPWTVRNLDPATVRLTPAPGSLVANHYPDLTYLLGSTAPIGDDGALRHGPDAVPTGLLVTETRGRHLELTITGSLTDPARAAELLARRRTAGCDVDAEFAGHRETMRGLALGLRLDGDSMLPIGELNSLLPWYVHNALIHFLVPHGLEQYSGAAWGTRDVCQGPFELHLAFGRFDIARQILLTTFTHQMPAGDFPQWFMFDAYVDAYHDDAHGDVPVWPLFALGQYLRATGDLGVLDVEISFWDDVARRPGHTPVPLATHVTRLLDYLDEHRLPGTALPAYGHGDWDDTLQPADPAMRSTMSSTWTSALLVQAAGVLADNLTGTPLGERLTALSEAVAADLRAHMLAGGVLAGYLNRVDERDELVIHPGDERTGIDYRLIPMTRSIIAGILDPQEAAAHEALIRRHLHFPDGVRLMNRPAAFDDGVPHVFLRAEQSANVGREIGLMYTHAHIRWVEALATLGRADTVEELLRISPLGINARLDHAAPRQRNVYYSSSDAAFANRYAFAAGFDRLRTGRVAVKGGWRVYSSGPGIYLRQLVQGVLGLQVRAGSLVIDPVLPADADGLIVDIDLAGERRRVRYLVRDDVAAVRVRVGASDEELLPMAGAWVANFYRAAALEIPLESLRGAAVLEVTTPAGS